MSAGCHAHPEGTGRNGEVRLIVPEELLNIVQYLFVECAVFEGMHGDYVAKVVHVVNIAIVVHGADIKALSGWHSIVCACMVFSKLSQLLRSI